MVINYYKLNIYLNSPKINVITSVWSYKKIILTDENENFKYNFRDF